MKKLIFLAILIISSLIFGEPHVTKKYYFIANKLHCTQPDYRITKFYQAMGGNMTLIFKNCYSNNVKMNYSDFTIILTNVKKDAYERNIHIYFLKMVRKFMCWNILIILFLLLLM